MIETTREELELVQDILDKLQYAVLFELHLDEYWTFTVDSEVKFGHSQMIWNTVMKLQKDVELQGISWW